ncbi:MAG: serine/threonine-protein kinase [Anaerolineae bacterium]|nr:serine/threonine-protein kinase [Anaerolineae bacterium]
MTIDRLIGKKFGPYYIEGLIGRGSVAAIYRALNEDEEVIALKVLFPPVSVDNEEILARFEREARTASHLDHPNIVPVFDAGQIDGRAYMAMKFVQGEPLAVRLKTKGSLDELTALDIVLQVAHGLHYAHLEGVVHRDVKPSNVLVTKDNAAFLTDFGVAQALDAPSLTQAGHIVGTPAYMAPEQALSSKAVDGRSDLYSLGIMLYRMVTGRLPFRGTTPELLHAHVYETPPPPSSVAKISPTMEAIILRAIAKKPEDRYQDGASMAQALTRLDYKLREEREQRKGSWQAAVKNLFGWGSRQ